MPAAALIPAIIGVGSSVAQGVMGSRAANNAANIQAGAAQQAGQMVQDAGNSAADNVNAATTRAIEGVNTATTRGTEGLQFATNQSIEDANNKTNDAIGSYKDSAQAGNDILSNALKTIIGNQSAYTSAGNDAMTQLRDLLSPGGALSKDFSFNGADLANTPGYQFQLAEGQKALERSAAARGSAVSGSALKGILKYSQGLADTTYGEEFNRQKDVFQMNRDNKLNPLYKLAQFGQDATQNVNLATTNLSNSMSNNVTNAGKYTGDALTRLGEFAGNTRMRGAEGVADIGMRGAQSAGAFDQNGANMSGNLRMRGTEGAANYLTDAAAARANGKLGSANAWGNAIGSGASAVNGAIYMNQVLGRGRDALRGIPRQPPNRQIDWLKPTPTF